jgi:hypothetical protein
MPAAMLALTSCSTKPTEPTGQQEITMIETKDGAAIIDTFTMTAKVTAIDATKRKLTLTTPDGKRATYKAGPDVINFNQIKIGDQVKAMVTEELAVFLRKDGTPPSVGEAGAVALAPKGAKPGVLMADTVELTAQITAIDAKSRKATLQFVDGSTKQLKVGKDADLTRVKPGDAVTVRVTEALALLVEKP